jgi:hypothetical protein
MTPRKLLTLFVLCTVCVSFQDKPKKKVEAKEVTVELDTIQLQQKELIRELKEAIRKQSTAELPQ